MSIYKDFNIEDPGSALSSDIVTNVRDTVSSGMWENGSGTLTAFYTSSTQSGSSAAHYLDVYGTNPQSDSTAQAQFSIAYGDVNGSGSLGTKGVDGDRASAAIYRQLSNVLLGPTEEKFTFAGTGDNITPNFVYSISVARQQLREKMDPGNWELHISGSTEAELYKFIDDSGATTSPEVNQGGRVFNVVSGSISSGVADTDTEAASQDGGGYGLFYPDLGIIIFNGPVLNISASFAAETGSNANGANNETFYDRIRVAGKFQSRREEVITSQHYFCRVPNKEFNFSSNPTFTSGSDGSFTNATFFKNPKTFITQVGLYNDNNELLAIAKLSKPLLKSYSREAIIKVKLDF